LDVLDKNWLLNSYTSIKEKSIEGRQLTVNKIEPLLDTYSQFSSEKIGESELGKPIYEVNLGSGKRTVLIWSQMHGNESTGTKAVFDLLNFLHNSDSQIVKDILSNCTLKIIPILNPDGAEAYTRVNANEVDLNRDAVDLTQKESKLLRKQLDSFNPEFCFNLHDQRTIFGVDGTENPATLSFLAPSEDESRKLTKGREKTMNIIVAINTLMQQIIPNHIGRFTDEFYPNATGDNFQKLGHSTILVESGHYPNDYTREEVRKFTFFSMLQGLYHIGSSDTFNNYKEYFSIPENIKCFYDLKYEYPDGSEEVFQFKENLENEKITFIPTKVENIIISDFYYHKEIKFKK